jgi:hypothetical protein
MRRAPKIFPAILLALPFAILLLNRNWPFQNFGDYDAFFYFGHFLHFPHYQKLAPSYAGERLPWILPGYAFFHVLGPTAGEFALHFLVWYTSVFSLCSIVTKFTTPQTGFLTACALGIHPYFLAAAGMDYVIGPCIAYALLTFALLIRPSRVCLLLAGITWAAAVYCYPIWLLFTPACIPIYLSAHVQRRVARDASLFAAGALVLTVALALLHHHIYGDGFNFQPITIATIRGATSQHDNPYANPNFSVTYADWLVFPGLAAALAVWLLITEKTAVRYLVARRNRWYARPHGRASEARPVRARVFPTRYLALSYLYCAAVMLMLTLGPARILEFDYFASFLIPGAFIVLGIFFFRLEDRWTTSSFWLLAAVTCAISLAPLAHPGLYKKPPVMGTIAPGILLTAAFAIRMFRTSPKAMIISAPLLAAANFCLAPAVGGIAWKDPRDWMSATTRVAQAVKIIRANLPDDQRPAFWFQQSDPATLEYQAIMCAFLAHGISELNFPVIDRKYPPGQIVIILSPTALANSPWPVLWQQSAGTIQITATGIPQ